MLGGNQARGLLVVSPYNGVMIENSDTAYNRMNDIKTNGLDGKYAFNSNDFVLKNGIFLNKSNKDLVKQAIKDNGSVGISFLQAMQHLLTQEKIQVMFMKLEESFIILLMCLVNKTMRF